MPRQPARQNEKKDEERVEGQCNHTLISDLQGIRNVLLKKSKAKSLKKGVYVDGMKGRQVGRQARS